MKEPSDPDGKTRDASEAPRVDTSGELTATNEPVQPPLHILPICTGSVHHTIPMVVLFENPDIDGIAEVKKYLAENSTEQTS